MEAKFARLRSGLMLLVISMGLVVGGQTWAKQTTLDYEQAVLVSKFAKHIGWPDEEQQNNFVIGVYKDTEKYEYFSDFFADKGVKGKDIVVQFVEKFSETKDVNILYVSSPHQRSVAKLVDNIVSGSHVLIVTENNKDLSKTMIDISYNESKSEIVFKVNDANIAREKLKMPELSYFLDNNKNDEVLSVSPTAAKKNLESKQAELEKQVAMQKAALAQLNKKLDLSKENTEKYNYILDKQTERIELANEENDKIKQEIKTKNKKLQRLEKQLKEQDKQLKMNKEEWQLAEDDKAKEQESAIIKLTEELEQQNEALKKQKEITNNTSIKLSDMTKSNKNLSSFQMLFYVFVLIALITLVIAFIMWKKAKKAESQPSITPENNNNPLLPVREQQLIRSENIASLGYLATDITYAVGLSLDDLQEQFESEGDTKNAKTLKPIVTLLENFNVIAADQDDTDIQSFDLIAYIQKMVMLYDFEFNQSDIAYSYSGEQKLITKSVPSYIALTLSNIINNALKHGFDNEGNGKISLNVEKGAKSGAKITFFDDGKGMNKSTLDKVFEPFFTTRSDRGYVGVGMSTTYDLIKNKLNGDIKIESKEGKCTTVIIALP